MAGDYTPREVAQLVQAGEVQLIDVREPEEYEAGRIAGGRLIPLNDLAAHGGSTPGGNGASICLSEDRLPDRSDAPATPRLAAWPKISAPPRWRWIRPNRSSRCRRPAAARPARRRRPRPGGCGPC